jgi:hypothetical protein
MLLALAVVAIITVFGDATAHAAGGGYGPGIAGAAGTPGGFNSVVTTHAFSTSGGAITAAVPGGQAQLTVPDGAFAEAVQAVITAPDLSSINAALPQLGFAGYTAIAGIGISIDDANGKPITELFTHPLTLTITGAGIGAGDLLVEFTSLTTAATLQSAVFSNGSVTVSLTADPDFAVLAPSATASSPANASASAGATASPTAASSTPPTIVEGEQFTKTGSGISLVEKSVFTVLAALVIVAALIIVMARRRRPDSFVPKHSAAGTPAKQQRAQSPTFAPKHARS